MSVRPAESRGDRKLSSIWMECGICPRRRVRQREKVPTGYVIIVAITIQLLTHGAAAAVLNEVRRIRGILTSGKSRTQGMPGMHQVQERLPTDKKAGRAIGKEDIHLEHGR